MESRRIADWYHKTRSLILKLPIPDGAFRAYLFDCDGTVVDSMPLHYIAWKKALGEWGCTYDEELFYAWGGRPIREIISLLNKQQGLNMPVEEVAIRKENYYFDLLPELKAIPEVVEHIDAMHGQIPFAIASGSRRDSVESSLKITRLIDKFETLVCADDYKRGKPAPDCFLLAAERLGVKAEDCLVFEDTELGVRAATEAGMASVKVPLPLERVS
jgi:HAD superfamily hydrolase (TIGR01509 family)